jgi:hypothetical protein
MTPDARAVFEEHQNADGLAEPELAEGFNALTAVEKGDVTEASQLLEEVRAEEDATARHLSRRRRRLWIASLVFSAVCMIALSGILIDVYTAPTKADPADTVVTTQDDVNRYMATHLPTPMPGSRAPIFIPTGLFITSLEFTGPYTVEVSGEIWQRYTKDLPRDLTRGVFLPLAEDQPTFKELYREQQGDEEVIGWTFHASMREQFDYSRYPMGRHQIRLRMYHPDFENNVYLTPDLAAYDPVDPASVPGVDPVMILENWDLQQAFVHLRRESTSPRALLQHRR